MHFFDIASSKSRPLQKCFDHFESETCFAQQRRALFHVLSGQPAPHPLERAESVICMIFFAPTPHWLSPGLSQDFTYCTFFFCSNALIALARSLCKCLLAVLITASEAIAVTGFLVRGASQYDTIPRREKKNTATKPTQASNKTTKKQHKKAQKHHKNQNITKWNDISKSNDET